MIKTSTFIIAILGLMVQASIAEVLIFEELDAIINEQHIFDICKNTQKTDEPCTIINQIFKNAEWHTLPLLKKIWNINHRPMPADLTRAVLRAQATKIGTRMGWDEKYLLKEVEILFNQYENLINPKNSNAIKTHNSI